ncbi:MAG TPA: hypothetical protein VMZ52_12160 [Bryobacteraceae bacterium]|nr:hypothetical protein [Bryobacteraceae bacterium]
MRQCNKTYIMWIPLRILLALIVVAAASAQNLEDQALQISRNIQQIHVPFGTILDPMYPSASNNSIIGYTRCGDSATWTGHYLAAEAFRYKVTRSTEALENARRALAGIQQLVDATGGDNLLARCVVPVDSPFAAGIAREEANNVAYPSKLNGKDYLWIGHTSRDQYMGVFFGLSVAYEQIEDVPMRSTISGLVTRLVDRLLEKNWAVVMPDGSQSTVFWLRPDQELAILQVARQVNPVRFRASYESLRQSASGLKLPLILESFDEHGSYFKFNINAVAFYTLIHQEESNSPKLQEYLDAYGIFRNTTSGHGNAFFNVVDRVLRGPDRVRDSETVTLLSQWLLRPRRDFFVDLRGKVKACGEDRACDVIPVPRRVNTDFLWQRSPFLLYGGGSGTIESPGIDFILPYWMARANGLDLSALVVSAASGASLLAPDSIASIYGRSLAASTATARPGAPETLLGGTRIQVQDAAGQIRDAPLFYASPDQVNFLIPSGTSTGLANITVVRADSTSVSTTSQMQRAAPGVFSASASGKGVAAALAVQVESNGSLTPLPVFGCAGPLICFTKQLDIQDKPVYLSLFGTGIRGASSPQAVGVTVGGRPVPVQYAGPQGQYPGLDQVNIRLTRDLHGFGDAAIVITVDGIASNSVLITFK